MSASADIKRFQEDLRRKGAALQQRAVRAMDRFGIYVLSQATERAPIDTGDLRASAQELPAEINGGKVTKVIGFGMEYAAAVHENLNAKHKQGQAKFLESAVRENESKMAAMLGRIINSGGES